MLTPAGFCAFDGEPALSALAVCDNKDLGCVFQQTPWQCVTTKTWAVCTGTPHKPPVLTPAGFCVFEGAACADVLLAEGVPAARLLKETASFDTIGNAYFSATIHAWPRRWRRIAVATSAFHMPRTQTIYEAVFRFLDAAADTR